MTESQKIYVEQQKAWIKSLKLTIRAEEKKIKTKAVLKRLWATKEAVDRELLKHDRMALVEGERLLAKFIKDNK